MNIKQQQWSSVNNPPALNKYACTVICTSYFFTDSIFLVESVPPLPVQIPKFLVPMVVEAAAMVVTMAAMMERVPRL